MAHPSLNDKDLLIVQAMRNAANHIESGHWVLEHNTVKALRVSSNPMGTPIQMVVTLNFAAVRTRLQLLKPGTSNA